MSDNFRPVSVEDIYNHFPATIAFVDLLRVESDRGCALVAAAELDNNLVEAIRARFIGRASVKDEMLKQSGAIGSFSARIDMAYLLGAVSENEHRDLHLIRKIRNDFGHVASPLSFATQSIRSRCEELRTVPVPFPTRYRFMLATAMLHGSLQRRAEYISKASLPEELPVIDLLYHSVNAAYSDQLERYDVIRFFTQQLKGLMRQRST